MRLNELELIARLRQPGGSEFVQFCNEVFQATCLAHGIPLSELSITLRTDIPDGGVDARVGRGIPGDRHGYFEAPSVWQFKAADEANVGPADAREEINKQYARECVGNGDAYRMCICDHLTVNKKTSLETALTEEATKINPAAPAPKVLGVEDLVKIANSYPALVMAYRPSLEGTCILFDRWAETMRRVTDVFVPCSSFAAIKEMVARHIDFATPTKDAVLPLRGQSGVGKTRSVYESLREHPGANSLVLYSENEDALESLATTLVSDKQHAVIVADECSLSTRAMLSRKLLGHTSLIRCISIDNSSQRIADPTPELEVHKPNQLELQAILTRNFPSIPSDRLRAYSELSEGFVRLAVDMCAHYDDAIRQAGSISPIVGQINTYYQDRLGSDQRMRALEAISLLKRVKRKGEAPTELDRICQLTDSKRHEIEELLNSIKDSPGFVERGELYYRVTPEIIALIAFESAWKRWAAGREDEFLKSVPEEIQESFLQRVSEGRSTEVRNTVQKFFRRFADSFSGRDLADLSMVNKLSKLVSTDPEQYLPRLREIVRSADRDDLVQVSRWGMGSWGPRRQLVWLTESLAQFADFLADCEDILFVLANNECEPDIGNNATKTWQRLFRMTVSGTSTPLPERLEILRKRIRQATAENYELIAGALGKILDFQGTRLLGPAVIGGRIVPTDWNPRPEEVKELISASLALIDETTRHPVRALARKAQSTLFSKIETLARFGWVDQVRGVAAGPGLDEHDRALLVGKLKGFANRAGQTDRRDANDSTKKLQEWLTELEPQSLGARLAEAVGTGSLDYFGRESEWQSQLQTIASQFLEDEQALTDEIEWLTSPDARSSFEFGHALGTVDSQAKHMDFILERSTGREVGLARGYVAGIIQAQQVDATIINERLDLWETKDALFAFQVALAGGVPVRVFERTLNLISSGKLPAYQLRNFTHWVGNERVSIGQVLEALEVLVPRAAQQEPICSGALMDFLGARAYAGQISDLLTANRALVWKALAVFTERPSREAFWWKEVLIRAAPDNPQMAIDLACQALVGESFEMKDEATNLLANWASEYPDEVMESVGERMLDPVSGVWFFISKFPVFTALPLNTITAWLEKVGVEGARKIARHVPHPHLDSEGEPVVPEITAWLLSHFEDDDRTFAEFCAGVHSLQTYVGDIAGTKESEAQAARKFFNHELPRIRQWARIEHQSSLNQAQTHREWEDEMNL